MCNSYVHNYSVVDQSGRVVQIVVCLVGKLYLSEFDSRAVLYFF